MSQSEFMTPTDVRSPLQEAIRAIVDAEDLAALAVERLSEIDFDGALHALRDAGVKLTRAERAIKAAQDEKESLVRNN